LPERRRAAIRRLGPFENNWHAITALWRTAMLRGGQGNCTTFAARDVADGFARVAGPRWVVHEYVTALDNQVDFGIQATRPSDDGRVA
jgi:hypothetical protein